MRVLFANEMGEGHGHMAPCSSLLESLAGDGWEIAAAVRDTAAGTSHFAECRASILQSPVCVAQFEGLPQEEIDYHEVLFKFGYAHVPTLTGMLAAWHSLLLLVKPDFVLANTAPGAQLVARSLRIPVLRLGTGWNCPPDLDPMPLIRGWNAEIEGRRDASQRLALATANASLQACGLAPLSAVTELHAFPTLLCTYPELDPYAAVRKEVTYVGLLPQGRRTRSTGATPDCDVFAYTRVTRHTDLLLDDLRRLPVKSAAWIADLGESDRLARTGGNLRLLEGPADLDAVLARARVVVGYASHGLTAAALLAGKPLLMMPMHHEQYLTAKRVEDAGAGLVVLPWEERPKLARLLRRLLEEPAFAANARALGGHLGVHSPDAALRRARELCTTIAPGHEPRLRSVG